jgi:predicted ArsR family transcriptional regulator
MSLQALDWAMRKALPCSPKMVLMMIANRADESGAAKIAVPELAEACGLSPSTVKRLTGELRAIGLLDVTERGSGGGRTSNTYMIPLEKSDAGPYNGGSSLI